MKLHESLVKQGCLDGTIEFEAHDRVPFFIAEGIPVIGEEELDCYKETYNGVDYYKMDSTHKNTDGTFSGAEPTYSASMNQERQKLWAEQYELVTVDRMKELRRLDAMTPEQYRQERIAEYMARQNETYIEFYAPVKNQVLKFGVDSQKKFEILFQMDAMKTDPTKTLTLHDMEFKNEEDFTAEEANIVVGAMMAETLTKEFTEGAFIKRLMALEEGFTKEDVDVAASPPLTDEEIAWVQSEVARKLGL